MKKLRFFIFLYTLSLTAFSQNGLGVFYDYNNRLHVFDKGIERQLEYYFIKDIYIGNNYIAYIDSKSSLIYYHDGEKKILEENVPSKIIATPTALVYMMQQRLMICENGTEQMLSQNAETPTASDSIIIWQDRRSFNYMSYQKGEINTFINSNSYSVINDFQLNNNILAFNDLNYNFKIYWEGKIYETDNTRITDFKCDHNIVAFTDSYKNTFNVFYKGELKTITEEVIQDYIVSNDMIAYVEANGNFNIFYKGVLTNIDNRKPDYYYSKGNVLYYSFNNELKIVYEGKIYTESLIKQENIILGNNTLLFYSNINKPKCFYKGKIIDNFYIQKPYTMELNQDLPVFKYNNTIGFLYNEKIYEFGSKPN